MRKYTLASTDARSTVDLRNYADTITSAVREVIPSATVEVMEDCYYVSPTPSLGEAIRIGRQICKSGLNKHCVQIPKLFSSIEVDEKEADDNEPNPKQRHGGHH